MLDLPIRQEDAKDISQYLRREEEEQQQDEKKRRNLSTQEKCSANGIVSGSA